MDQQRENAVENSSKVYWVVEKTVVFRSAWSWDAPTTVKALGPEPPADGNQFRLFLDRVPRVNTQLVTGVAQNPTPGALKDDDEEPAHPDLEDPVVAAFVNFGLAKAELLTSKNGDVTVDHAFDPIGLYQTYKGIYVAFLHSVDKSEAVRVDEHVWRVEINYRELISDSGLSKRSLTDAIKMLKQLGYLLRHPEGWGGGHALRYYVRDPNGMKRIFDAAGVNRARKLGEGKILLFRAADKMTEADAE